MPNLLPAKIAEILSAANRLHVLRNSGINGPGHQPEFDGLTATAAIVFAAPVALVTMLDDDTQFIKSSQGFEIEQSPTETSFCSHALGTTEHVTVVLDASNDPRFADNPYVTNPPHVRFYAGCPITVEGENVGTVCVYDFEPRREISKEQSDTLKKLAAEAAIMITESRAGNKSA